MSGFLTLVHKEWRDQRKLVIVSVTMLVVGLVLLEWCFGDEHDEYTRLMGIWPAAVLLFLTAVAADVTTRDCTSGTGDTLGRLPVGRLRIWAAKLLFLAATSLAWLALVALCEIVVSFVEGRWPFSYPDRLPRPFAMVWSVVGAIPIVVFAIGTWVRRALPAAVVGVAVFGVPFALWSWLRAGSFGAWVAVALDPWSPAGLGATVALLFTICSITVYRPWSRLHGDLRRWLVGGTTFVLTFGSVSVFAATRAVRAIDAVPGGPHHYMMPDVSPDGRYLAVHVTRQWDNRRRTWLDGPVSWNYRSSSYTRQEVWILDRQTKAWTIVDERPRQPFSVPVRGWTTSPWGADGLLRTFSMHGPFGSGLERREVIDPATGEIVHSEPAESDAVEFENAAEIDRWGSFEVPGELTWTATEVRTPLPPGDVLALSPAPGVIFLERDGALLRHDLTSGTELRLGDLPGTKHRRVWVSPDGRHVAWRVGGELRIVRSADGTTVFGPQVGFLSQWCSAGDQIALLNGSEWMLVTEYGTHELPRGKLGDWYRPCDAEHLLRVTAWPNEASGIELVDLDGNLVDVLYEPNVDAP